MKLTIKTNGVMNAVNLEPTTEKNVRSVEIDFIPAVLWSDFELWLEDDDGNLVDYKNINLTNRNKMRMSGSVSLK